MSFWCAKIKAGEQITLQDEGEVLHLTQACLASPTSSERCVVAVSQNGVSKPTAMVALTKDQHEHANLDLFFSAAYDPETDDVCPVVFKNQGKNEVHLMGYFEPKEDDMQKFQDPNLFPSEMKVGQECKPCAPGSFSYISEEKQAAKKVNTTDKVELTDEQKMKIMRDIIMGKASDDDLAQLAEESGEDENEIDAGEESSEEEEECEEEGEDDDDSDDEELMDLPKSEEEEEEEEEEDESESDDEFDFENDAEVAEALENEEDNSELDEDEEKKLANDVELQMREAMLQQLIESGMCEEKKPMPLKKKRKQMVM